MKFIKATKHESRLRLALIGPAGTGKTYSALAIATALVPGGKVAVIDTERGSASKYADQFAFDVAELDRHSPTDYVAAIRAAEEAGYDVVVVDSLSHAWSGKGGALELVDQAAKRARTPNTFGAWREVTPLHNEMVDAIVGSKAHIIVTMRAKTEWVQEQDERGKTRIRKVGLAPVQRDGLEYEFDVVGDLDQEHSLLVTKTRCSALANAMVLKPGKELADVLRAWLQGAPAQRAPEPAPEPKPEPKPAPAPTQYIEVQPKEPAPEPTSTVALEDVLARMQACTTEAELLEVGQLARALPSKHLAVARKAYAYRVKLIQRRTDVLKALRVSLMSDRAQNTIDALGANGVVLDDTRPIDALTDDEIDVVATTLEVA